MHVCHLAHQTVKQLVISYINDGDHVYAGVEGCNCLHHRLGLVLANALCGVRNLTLQVGGVNTVIINQRDAPNPCTA